MLAGLGGISLYNKDTNEQYPIKPTRMPPEELNIYGNPGPIRQPPVETNIYGNQGPIRQPPVESTPIRQPMMGPTRQPPVTVPGLMPQGQSGIFGKVMGKLGNKFGNSLDNRMRTNVPSNQQQTQSNLPSARGRMRGMGGIFNRQF